MRWALTAAFALAMLVGALAPAPPGFVAIDKIAHVMCFGVLALMLASLRRPRLSLVALASFAIAIELAQAAFTRDRTASAFDALASITGASLGLALPATRPRANLAALSAAALLFQASFTLARPATIEALNAAAWSRATASHRPQEPWMSAHAAIAYRLDIVRSGAAIYLANTADRSALTVAPGLWRGSAPPGAGFSIFMGHRNRAFRALGALAIGDELAISDTNGRTQHYRVSSLTVAPYNHSGLRLNEPGDGLALVTCWPVASTKPSALRLIVRAAPLAADTSA